MAENSTVDSGSSELSVEKICDYPVHPAASAYPLMEGADWELLVESIRRDMRVQEPVVFQDGVLLDGRNRLRAKELIEKETGKTVEWMQEEFKPEWGDVIDWIQKRNTRRNLTPDQLAVIAADLHSLREQALADERKKRSQFGSRACPTNTPQVVTPNPGSPSQAGNAGVAAGDGTTKSKQRNPTAAALIAAKAGPGVKRHHMESVFKIQKEMGREAIEDIRRGTKTIATVKKALPKAAKPAESLDTRVEKRWEKFKKSFDAADLPKVCVVLKKLIDAEAEGCLEGGAK